MRAALSVSFGAVAGDRDQMGLRGRRLFAELVGEMVAVEFGEADVAENEVGMELESDPQPLGAGGRDADVMARQLEKSR